MSPRGLRNDSILWLQGMYRVYQMVSYTPWHFQTKNDDIQKGMGRDRRGGSNDSPTIAFDSFDVKSLSI